MHDRQFGALGSVKATEPRRHPRMPVRLPCTLSGSDFGRRNAVLRDVSVTGARLLTPFNFNFGQVVVLTVPGLAPMGAKVVWCTFEALGLDFSKPLHPTVVDHLVKLSRAVAPEDTGYTAS